MNIVLDLESKIEPNNYGNQYPIKQFIEDCESRGFIDYDGWARELILDNKVVWNKESIYPSDALRNKEKLLYLESRHPGLKIMWYNR
jgi:hypothetical protein